MPKNKFYVVWKGKKPGIYEKWNDCKKQVEGVEGALYKGFPTLDLAKNALDDDPWKHMSKAASGP
jgi:ribonuclease HI